MRPSRNSKYEDTIAVENCLFHVTLVKSDASNSETLVFENFHRDETFSLVKFSESQTPLKVIDGLILELEANVVIAR
ncbi:hypothetical protein K0M31_016565 [Melipona bicolor]|uniref:Uncharacterized protein n=1 Tax=Melipona bicolor TaxID=60889 RepID=A0AA40FEG6_9HYME|nr:hypothetical protein K0M31_016565 [Melipona bicolor]